MINVVISNYSTHKLLKAYQVYHRMKGKKSIFDVNLETSPSKNNGYETLGFKL